MSQKRTTATGKTRWVGRYRDPAGKDRSKTFDTKRDAVAWENEKRRDIRHGEWIAPETQSVTVREIMDRWCQRPMRDGTARAYRLTRDELGPLADIPAGNLLRSDVDAWHKQLLSGRPWRGKKDTGLAASTAREHLVRLSSALNAAVDDRVMSRNPVRIPATANGSVSRSEIPRMEVVAEIVALLENGGARYPGRQRVPGHRGKWRPVTHVQDPAPVVADMVRTDVGTGLRVSELCGLQVPDVDFLRREIRVDNQLDTSGRHLVPLKTSASQRVIPVADDLLELLDSRVSKSVNGWLFETAAGTPFRASTAGGELRKAVGHLGVPVTFHSFRHLYASRLIAAGVSVKQVQRLMGHGSASTTLDTYTHFWPSDDEVSRAAIFGAVEACGIFEGSGDGDRPLRSV